MRYVVFLFACTMMFLTGCRTGTVIFTGDIDQQAKRTAETVREICQYPSYSPDRQWVERYRTIIAALIINRSAIEQSEDYRVRLINVLTSTGIPIDFADRITKVILYGYMQQGAKSEFGYYLHRLLFHLDKRQVFYDPYSDVVFLSAEPKTNTK